MRAAVTALVLTSVSLASADPIVPVTPPLVAPFEPRPWVPRLLDGRLVLEGPGGASGPFDRFARAGAATLRLDEIAGWEPILRLEGGERILGPELGLDPTLAEEAESLAYARLSLAVTRRLARGWWLDLFISATGTQGDPLRLPGQQKNQLPYLIETILGVRIRH